MPVRPLPKYKMHKIRPNESRPAGHQNFCHLRLFYYDRRREMRKKVIVFDLDGTLAPSKSPLPDRIAQLLNKLLVKYQVCIISGGKYELFQEQILTHITT